MSKVNQCLVRGATRDELTLPRNELLCQLFGGHKAEFAGVGTFFCKQISFPENFLVKKFEIEETKTPFITSVLKVEY